MNTDDLRAFMVVYEERSIASAANKLFISPQGCGKIVRRLEQEIGSPLFTRSHSGVVPTASGDGLYERAESIMHMLEDVTKGTAPAAQQLRVYSTLGIRSYLTNGFFSDFAEKYPSYALGWTEAPDRMIQLLLDSNEVELAILGGSLRSSEYNNVPFTKHRPCVVVSADNPLAGRDHIAYEDLIGMPIGLEGRDFFSYHRINEQFRAHGVTLSIVLETTEIAFLHSSAANSDVVGISIDFAARSDLRDGLRVIPFEDDSFFWETYIVHKLPLSRARRVRDFCAFAQSWYAHNANKLA